MTAAAHPRISYDTVPYPTFAQRQTHPDRLALQATLHRDSTQQEVGIGGHANLRALARDARFLAPASRSSVASSRWRQGAAAYDLGLIARFREVDYAGDE